MVDDDQLAGILAAVISSICGMLITLAMVIVIISFCCGGGIALGDDLPGVFDDSEQFMKEEEQALELMNEESRQSYLMAKRFVEHNPPNSGDTDISLSQFMAIQEKGVNAWEFTFDILQQSVLVQNRLEIEFRDSVCSVCTNLPLPKQNDIYYWECKIYDLPPHTTLGVGLITKPYPMFRIPGMHRYSVSYESTGFRRLNQPFSARKYGHRFQRGDVIGVGCRTRTGTIFFTHNGKKLDDVVNGMRMNLFPTIGATGPCQVYVNLGQAGFVYLEANVKKWGLAPAQGTLAPPPAYGEQEDSVLLQATTTRRTPPPVSPPSFVSGPPSIMDGGDPNPAPPYDQLTLGASHDIAEEEETPSVESQHQGEGVGELDREQHDEQEETARSDDHDVE